MRLLFMGTPQFACPSLKTLFDAKYNIVGAITQPDRASGRGCLMKQTPVKKLAKEYNIPIESIRSRLGVASGKPDRVADNLKGFFDNGLGLVMLVFIDREDIPLFAEEVIPQLR